jgi:hypothetical protein
MNWQDIAKFGLIFVPYFVNGIIWEFYRDDLDPWIPFGDWECIGVAGSVIVGCYYLVRQKQQKRAEKAKCPRERQLATRPNFD